MNDQAANLTSMQQSGCEEQQHMDVVPWNSQLTGNVLSSLQQEHKTTEDTKQQFPSHEEHEIFEGELQLQKNEGKDEANDKAEEQQRPKINCPEKIVCFTSKMFRFYVIHFCIIDLKHAFQVLSCSI